MQLEQVGAGLNNHPACRVEHAAIHRRRNAPLAKPAGFVLGQHLSLADGLAGRFEIQAVGLGGRHLELFGDIQDQGRARLVVRADHVTRLDLLAGSDQHFALPGQHALSTDGRQRQDKGLLGVEQTAHASVSASLPYPRATAPSGSGALRCWLVGAAACCGRRQSDRPRRPAPVGGCSCWLALTSKRFTGLRWTSAVFPGGSGRTSSQLYSTSTSLAAVVIVDGKLQHHVAGIGVSHRRDHAAGLKGACS